MKNVKIFLDDIRDTPSGYIRAYNYQEMINLLKSYNGHIEEISLDHDLGEEDKTGYDVLLWIEEQQVTCGYVPPRIKIHSANPVGCYRMGQAIDSIERRR